MYFNICFFSVMCPEEKLMPQRGSSLSHEIFCGFYIDY